MRHFCGSVLVALIVSAIGVVAQRPDPSAAGSLSKLSTILSDLSQAVSQQPVTAARAGVNAPLSAGALPQRVQDAMHAGWLRVNANNEVQVYILMSEVSAATVAQLTSAGVTIEMSDPTRRRVQARVPVSLLQAVAQLPVVDAVRLPTYARRKTGSVTTEGDVILFSDNVRSMLNIDGTGVRVGVISDGLKGVFATGCTTCADVAGGPISTLDLPTATGFRTASGVLTSTTGGIVGRSFQANQDLEGLPPASPVCADPGAGAEGTALLEIVHDIAPGALLSFANSDTDLAFAQAVNFLAASNDVVLDDIGFYGLPYDGTSGVSSNTAAALNTASNPVRAYFTAVGNDADEHYYGGYADSGIDGTTISGITTPGHLHLFSSSADTTDVLGLGSQPYNVIRLPAKGEVAIFLTWDDAFGAAADDYDLYLVQQSTGRVVASSTDVQNGKQDPVEFIDYVNPGAQDFFRLIVQNVRGLAQPKNLNIFSFQPGCAAAGPTVLAPPRHELENYNTAAKSVSAESDAGGSPASVLAVGAVCSASAAAASASSSSVLDQSCLDTTNSTAEFYSSHGPTLDGRVKPDITGVDGVSVTGAGSFPTPFFGTSAASPHLGAIAALALQGAPCLLGRSTSTIDPSTARATLRNLLLGHAIALSSSAPDNTFGAGRVDAFASVNATVPSRSGSSNVVIDGNSPFGAAIGAGQLGFSDPDGCPLTAMNWSGGCGTAPSGTMTCPVGTSALSVAASNNGISYSAASNVQITVTDFSMTVSSASAVASGRSATYTVTVTPQGGPYNSAVSLSCVNLPAGATCSFNPATVTPGNGPAHSVLTIATTANSSILPAAPTPTDRSRWNPVVRALREAPPAAMWLVCVLTIWLVMGRAVRLRTGASQGYAFAKVVAAGSAVFCVVVVMTTIASAASGIALFPDSLTYGAQPVGTTGPSQVVSITNIGVDVLNITSIVAAGDFATATTCGSTLVSAQSCQIAVNFTPTISGARSGSVTITDDAAGSPQIVALTGTGQDASNTGGGTPTGTYNVTVAGQSGTLAHTTSANLTVQ